jgi:hypothetical protein
VDSRFNPHLNRVNSHFNPHFNHLSLILIELILILIKLILILILATSGELLSKSKLEISDLQRVSISFLEQVSIL